jgi:hypothetical protein
MFFLAVVFVLVFVLFVIGSLAKEEIGSYRTMRRVRVGAFWTYSAHAQSYA